LWNKRTRRLKDNEEVKGSRDYIFTRFSWGGGMKKTRLVGTFIKEKVTKNYDKIICIKCSNVTGFSQEHKKGSYYLTKSPFMAKRKK
jgi:hypothetical protein